MIMRLVLQKEKLASMHLERYVHECVPTKYSTCLLLFNIK